MEYLRLITWTIVLVYMVRGEITTRTPGVNDDVYAQCFSQELAPGVAEWQTNVSTSSVAVEWAYGNVSLPLYYLFCYDNQVLLS